MKWVVDFTVLFSLSMCFHLIHFTLSRIRPFIRANCSLHLLNVHYSLLISRMTCIADNKQAGRTDVSKNIK